MLADRKSTRLNSSHTVIYTLSLHDALPILSASFLVLVVSVTLFWALASMDIIHNKANKSFFNVGRSEEHTSELQSHSDLHSFPTRRSSDLIGKFFGFSGICNLILGTGLNGYNT